MLRLALPVYPHPQAFVPVYSRGWPQGSLPVMIPFVALQTYVTRPLGSAVLVPELFQRTTVDQFGRALCTGELPRAVAMDVIELAETLGATTLIDQILAGFSVEDWTGFKPSRTQAWWLVDLCAPVGWLRDGVAVATLRRLARQLGVAAVLHRVAAVGDHKVCLPGASIVAVTSVMTGVMTSDVRRVCVRGS